MQSALSIRSRFSPPQFLALQDSTLYSKQFECQLKLRNPRKSREESIFLPSSDPAFSGPTLQHLQQPQVRVDWKKNWDLKIIFNIKATASLAGAGRLPTSWKSWLPSIPSDVKRKRLRPRLQLLRLLPCEPKMAFPCAGETHFHAICRDSSGGIWGPYRNPVKDGALPVAFSCQGFPDMLGC